MTTPPKPQSWLTPNVTTTTIHLYIQPGSRKNEITGLFGDPERLKIKIHAQPADGEANEELTDFLCQILSTTKSKITLIRGATSRQKDFKIDLDADLIYEKIKPFLLPKL